MENCNKGKILDTNTSNNKRIAKNTLMLYARMFLTMPITLYSSRVVLNALGVDDFGLYSVVGGFVAMFAIISNSLTASISRFITYELGVGGNKDQLRKVFSTTVIIQLLISCIVIFLSETLGVWFLNVCMNIPSERLFATNWVFQFSLLSFITNLMSIPYNASIVAHEKMGAFAYISIVQAIGTLFVAFLIDYAPFDRLIFYAMLMLVLSVSIRCLYLWYCKKHFSECHFIWLWDVFLIKRIFSFAGWNFIGVSSGILRDHGVNILLNVFCGPVVNAARGVAMQVSGAVTSFANNFMMALNPQITKSYAVGNLECTMDLVLQGARYSFYLLLLLSLPVLMETHTILKLWLKIVPDYTVSFVRLILLYAIFESISNTMITLMLATGKIRNYQLLVGGLQLMNFPISYLLLKIGYAPETTVLVAIGIAFCCMFLRAYMLRIMIGFDIRRFLHVVVLNVLLVSCLSLIIPYCTTFLFEEGIIRLVISVPICMISTTCVIFFIGCSEQERSFALKKIFQLKQKFFL